ncbi:arsenic resistance protein ArsA [Natrialba asiatica DSM 12278]|uniref:Arsenic resistance protein ArsA n=1 Tax=Natrialba asiatica (strain ATCC 700177 / DSM 12278 / JCM 9576 / FERM P-10747 / NBRC 102637 / 172P1) TaxID=29540 RepID=M0B8I0_NATA1|nr:ArsA-related P-loop ATPase [Natrialba asiatica]ELZ05954.1 arsenic resistance protein ArsA [Natrialba asiatica DSM 12278]
MTADSLVTTDPAPNPSDTFDQEIGPDVTEIDDIERPSAVEIDPDTAAEKYRREPVEHSSCSPWLERGRN